MVRRGALARRRRIIALVTGADRERLMADLEAVVGA